MTNKTLIKYWVAAVLVIWLTLALFMIVPTAIEANELYQTTKEITKVDQMIEYNSQRRLELEAEKELLEQKNKELRQQKQELQRSLIGDRVF